MQQKHVVLGLIFLKYISDKFEEKYNELVEEGEGFEEDRDEYESENIFFVPPKARWGEIYKHAHEEDNGIIIDEAMDEIEKENLTLKGILPKTFSRPELDKSKLGKVIDLFSIVEWPR